MFNLSEEKDKYLIACKSLKGLSDLTLKAYKIDLKQFCGFMNGRDCFEKKTRSIHISIFCTVGTSPKAPNERSPALRHFTDIWRLRTLLISTRSIK